MWSAKAELSPPRSRAEAGQNLRFRTP